MLYDMIMTVSYTHLDVYKRQDLVIGPSSEAVIYQILKELHMID